MFGVMVKIINLKFGDMVENAYAAVSNPHKFGYFVKKYRITGRLNPGVWVTLTDKKGNFWDISIEAIKKC